MARGNSIRPARRDEADYAINWRVAGTITALLLLIGIIPLSKNLWLPFLSQGSTAQSRESLTNRAEPNLASTSREKSPSEKQLDTGESIEPFTPWLPRAPNSQVVERSHRRVHSHAQKKEKKLDVPITTYAANVETNVEAFTEESSASLPETDQQLLDELFANSVEISIDNVATMRKAVVEFAHEDSSNAVLEGRLPGESLFFQLVGERSDLEGLPFRRGEACRKRDEALRTLKDLSGTVRQFSASRSRSRGGGLEDFEAEMALEGELVTMLNNDTWERPEAVMTLVQLLQTHTYALRLNMVDLLARIPGDEAAAALADRALFDLSPFVRHAAISALRSRRLSSATKERLLQGFRYPLPRVAENAADSIVKLRMRESIHDLEDFLDQPDPTAPFVDKYGQWRKTELVRMNHFRNCLLCHPVSTSKHDDVRGVIPIPGQRLPPEYYESRTGEFVRADSTYLHQDFSVLHRLKDEDPWGQFQRYDYLVRTRSLTAKELEKVKESGNASDQSRTYPQRDAVRRAILELQQLP
jgi:hypothetical protein